ncbi:MAG: hypothetical protein ACM3XM_12220 [Mycobacterium leprae]
MSRSKGLYSVAFVLLWLVLLNLTLEHLLPGSWLYRYRVDYQTNKNSMAAGLNLAMDRIAAEIRANPKQDYVILLGDSVMYSGPGGPEQSIGYYLEQWSAGQGHPLKVYNLAEPANFGADVYATLLMLQQHNIPLKRVVVDQVYSDFVPYGHGIPEYSWLGDTLQRLDAGAYAAVKGSADPNAGKSWVVRYRDALLAPVPLWRDRYILQAQIDRVLHINNTGEVTDIRPWTDKPWLKNLMQDPQYRRFVDPKPFDMTPANPQIAILQRMIAHLKGAEPLFIFTPVNHALLAPGADSPEYQANLKRVSDWFTAQQVRYLDLSSAMPSDQFVDHVHLMPEGYRQLAAIIGQELLKPPAAVQK